MSDSGEKASGGGLLGRIASSAEYSIAAALLAVCVVVGGALWLLQPEGDDAAVMPTATPTAQVAAVDEGAALSDWKRRLGEQFSEAEEQQRQRAAAEEQARRARAQDQEEAAAARRQAQAERQAQQRLEAAAGRQATPLPNTSASTPAPAPTTPVPRATAVQTLPPTSAPQPALVAAAIDWSSCELPSYPALSVRRGEEGTVVIAAELDAAARLLEASIAQSSGHSKLDRATLEAVRQCRFTPALENGIARAATAEVRFTWKLN